MVAKIYDEMIMILSKLIALLEKTEDYDWSSFLKKTRAKAINSTDNKQMAREILVTLYSGGMGSFLDLVLQKDMKPLIEEDDLLIKYRKELFHLCEKIIGESELNIKPILENLIILLRDNNEINWSIIINELLNKYVDIYKRNTAIKEIINIYKKNDVNSFVNLHIYKGPKFLKIEDNEFLLLREGLYKSCIEYCKNNTNYDM